jgi:tetratricopeptide (TPR) repeat protein
MPSRAEDASYRALTQPWVIALGCAIFAGIVFGHVITHNFVYDDVPIVNDSRLDEPGYITKIWTAPWWEQPTSVTISRPLTSLTLWAQVQIHGRVAWPFFVVNILLYALVCGLTASLACRWLGRWWAGWIVGLVFAAHPLHVEAVGNVVGRAELMSALFTVLGLGLWLAWRDRWTWRRSAIIALCVGAAGLSKEHGYLLAPMLVVMELARRRELGQALLGRPLPWRPALLIIAVAIGAFVQRQAVSRYHADRPKPVLAQIDNPLIGASLSQRAVTPLVLVGTAVRLGVAPVGQSPDYSPRRLMPTANLLDPMALLGLATVLAWLIATLWAGRRRHCVLGPLLCLPIAWFIPSNALILIGTIFGERLLFSPSVFVVLSVVGIASSLRVSARAMTTISVATMVGAVLVGALAWEQWHELFGVGPLDDPGVWIRILILAIAVLAVAALAHRAAARGLRAAALCTALAALCWCTALYSPVWRNAENFIVSVVARYPEDARFQATAARCSLLAAKVAPPESRDAMLAIAERHATTALELWPRQAKPYGVLGELARTRGDTALAREYFRIAQRWSHNQNHGDAGLVLLGTQLPREQLLKRIDDLRAQTRRDQTNFSAGIELAQSLLTLKDLVGAEREYRRILDAQPNHIEALDGYLSVLAWTDRHADALAICERLMVLKRESWRLLTESAMHAIAAGESSPRVEAWLVRAQELAPEAPAVHYALGQLHDHRGEVVQGAAACSRALELLPPNDPRRYQVLLLLEQVNAKAR